MRPTLNQAATADTQWYPQLPPEYVKVKNRQLYVNKKGDVLEESGDGYTKKDHMKIKSADGPVVKTMNKSGSFQYLKVSALVAGAFLGRGREHIRFRDGDPNNTKLENLILDPGSNKNRWRSVEIEQELPAGHQWFEIEKTKTHGVLFVCKSEQYEEIVNKEKDEEKINDAYLIYEKIENGGYRKRRLYKLEQGGRKDLILYCKPGFVRIASEIYFTKHSMSLDGFRLRYKDDNYLNISVDNLVKEEISKTRKKKTCPICGEKTALIKSDMCAKCKKELERKKQRNDATKDKLISVVGYEIYSGEKDELMTEKERDIMELRRAGKTLNEIAKKYGVTREMIRQIITKIPEKVESRLA